MFKYRAYLERIIDEQRLSAEAHAKVLEELRRREDLRLTMWVLCVCIVLAIVAAGGAQLLLNPCSTLGSEVVGGRLVQSSQERTPVPIDIDIATRPNIQATTMPVESAGGMVEPAGVVLPVARLVFVAVSWCLAWLAGGTLLGFIFGIPRISQGDFSSGVAPAGGAGAALGRNYRQLVNTNLEQISDWLTKIIVGIGLFQLRLAPSYLARAASYMADSPCAIACPSLAAAILITFSVMGFLSGYLATRMFLAPAFVLADQVGAGVSAASFRDVAVKPPEHADRKRGQDEVVASRAAKSAARKFLEVAQSLPVSKAGLYDLAKAQLLAGDHADAMESYQQVAAQTDDPRVHYEYALALSHTQGGYSRSVCDELVRAHAHVDRLEPEETRTELYVWLTYAFLYYPDERGYLSTISYGQEAESKGIRHYAIFLNLACAFAQAFARSDSVQEKSEYKQAVIKYMKAALDQNPGCVIRMRELLEKKKDKDPYDNDFEVFEQDNDVRAILGLPPFPAADQ